MREVLFRGKRANNNEWVEGGIISLDTDSGYIFIAEPFLSASTLPVYEIIKHYTHLVRPETVGQYTGLTDKNGKKIFEGDIINIEYFETVVENAVIEYIGTGFYGSTDSDDWELDGYCQLEVIGNIHDNPELLNN